MADIVRESIKLEEIVEHQKGYLAKLEIEIKNYSSVDTSGLITKYKAKFLIIKDILKGYITKVNNIVSLIPSDILERAIT